MSIIKNVVEQSHLKGRGHLLIESSIISESIKKELISITSGLSGAALAGMWASLGTMATATSVKGLLLAAGFTNPITLSTVGMLVAGAVATATVVAGGKLAYTVSKDATRGVFKPSESQRLVSDLIDVVRSRDAALYRNNQNKIIKTTDKMQKIAGKLHDAAIRDFKKGIIDRKVYNNYMTISKKGVLGRLSTIV